MPNTPARKTAAARSPVKAKPKVQAKAAAGDAAAVPFFRFFPSKSLHARLIATLDQIELAQDATVHHAKLADSVNELTAAGLDYYFIRTLKLTKVGFLTQQSANLGILGVQQVMAPVVRNIVGRLDHAQLQSVAQSIRALMATGRE